MMKGRTFKKIMAALLAVAMVITTVTLPSSKEVVEGATIGTGDDYTVTATDESADTTKLTFKAKNYAGYVIVHFKVNDGAQQNINMASDNGYDYTYAVTGLKKGDHIKCSFTYNKGGLQYDTPEMSYTTGSDVKSDQSLPAPFGLVVTSPSDNTIGVVWGRGEVDTYNVYVDGNRVSSSVACAYYTYTGIAAGNHTVEVSTTNGSSESVKVSGTVYVNGSTVETTEAPATTKKQETGVVYIYQDINYGGRVAALNEGSYNMAALQAKGFLNDDLSSLKVASGYEAVLYWDDNFQGSTKTVTADTPWIGADWNDAMTSIVVRKKTEPTTAAPTKAPQEDSSIEAPFGLVVSSPANNTIGVVWGRGNINSYNVYIDNQVVATKVGCAYYTYTGIAAGTHTVSVTTVSGSKESAKTTLSVTVAGGATAEPTTKAPEKTTAQQASGGTVSGVEKPALRNDIPVNDKMFLQLNNKTNGKYSDNQIYWCVLGYNANNQLCYLDTNGNLIPANTGMNTVEKNGRMCADICHSLSEKNWVYLPSIVSGRMYLSYGSPVYITFNMAADGRVGYAGPDLNNTSDPNQDVLFEFAEFTVTGREYWGNTTRVDFFSFPMVTRLYGTGGFDNRPGDYPTYDKVVGDVGTRTDIFNSFKNNAPAAWKTLVDDKRIMAPCKKTFNEGQTYSNYFDNYINEFWNKYSTQDLVFSCEAGTFTGRVSGDVMTFHKAGDGGTYYVYKPTTQDVLEGKGNFNRGNSTELVIEAQLCAAFNRGVATDPANYNNPGAYYKNSTYNWYSRFWHENSVNSLAYGFCYDDVNDQSTLLHYTNATALVIDLKW